MKKLFLLFAVPFMVTATANAQPTPASLRREIRMDKKNDNKMGEKSRRCRQGWRSAFCGAICYFA